MKYLNGLIGAAALALSACTAPLPGSVLDEDFDKVAVVTSCSQIVVVIITADSGETYFVDRDSGIPADALKSAIDASDAQLSVYEVGCQVPSLSPEITT